MTAAQDKQIASLKRRLERALELARLEHARAESLKGDLDHAARLASERGDVAHDINRRAVTDARVLDHIERLARQRSLVVGWVQQAELLEALAQRRSTT